MRGECPNEPGWQAKSRGIVIYPGSVVAESGRMTPLGLPFAELGAPSRHTWNAFFLFSRCCYWPLFWGRRTRAVMNCAFTRPTRASSRRSRRALKITRSSCLKNTGSPMWATGCRLINPITDWSMWLVHPIELHTRNHGRPFWMIPIGKRL